MGDAVLATPALRAIRNHYPNSSIYLYANKKPQHGMMEVVEVNSVAKERREVMLKALIKSPPDWIVLDDTAIVEYDYNKYRNVAKINNFNVYKRY